MKVSLMDMQRGTSLLCPECKSMSARLFLNRKTNQRECRKPNCGNLELNNEPWTVARERNNKQIIRSRGYNFELKDKVCKRYCQCAKCFATRNEPDSISFWNY